MKIPIAKPFLGKEEADAAHKTILSGWVTQGPKVAKFEQNFAQYVGSKYAVAVSNCTTALHLSMIVAGIKEGDEVICPSMSYVATANCIMYVGAKPVFAEVNKDFNLDINDVEKKINSKTKAILLVHQMGMPADIDNFKELCDRKKEIFDKDIVALVDNKVSQKDDLIKLLLLEVTCGSTRNPMVKVILNYKGKEIEKSNSGNGPVDAIFNCINDLIENHAKLELFLINAITKGTDAQAEVSVRLKENDISVSGTASDTDTMVASANAYIIALNKLIMKRKKRNTDLNLSTKKIN